MKNTKDSRHPTQPLPLWNGDLDDTLPPTRLPAELRPGRAEAAESSQAPERVRPLANDEKALNRQDEISTPAPLSLPVEKARKKPPSPRSSAAIRMVVGLCLVISLISLALNGYLIYSLLGVRSMAVEGLDAAIDALDGFGGDGFHYEYRFEQDIPFSGDIPFQQDLVFPFEGEIPINTTVEMPIDVGIQTFVVKVPIDTSVYVNTSVPVHVDQTVHVSTTIPVSMAFPIDIKPDDPAIQDLLSSVREWLVRLRESF
jgi:hypothetical protein